MLRADEIAFAEGVTLPPPLTEAELHLLETADKRAPASREPDSERHSWLPRDLVALDADPPPPPTIGGLVYPGRRHVFSGEPEALKSWAALVLAAEEIREGRSVLYADFEMGHAEMLERLRALGLTDEELELFLYVEPDEPMTQPSILADIDALLKDRRPTLVVFDSLTAALSLHGCDPNSGAEVERFYRTIVEPLRAYGAGVAMLDHVVKSRDARGKFSIGSERKLAAADVHLGFEVVRPFGRGKSGLARITTHKDRPGHLPRPKAAELELTSDPETSAISWKIQPAEHTASEQPFRPTNLMEKVSRYVELCDGDRPSRTDVEKNVTGRAEFVRLAIDVLVSEEYLEPKDGPRNASLLHSVKPYREADDDAS